MKTGMTFTAKTGLKQLALVWQVRFVVLSDYNDALILY